LGAIRLFLALVVATDHTRAFLMTPANLHVPIVFELGVNAGYAVMFFYMISGFLMAFVLKNNYPASASGTLKFYKSRFVRIFSLYWPVMAVALLVPNAFFSFVNGTAFDIFTGTFLFGIDWNVAFGDYPAQNGSAAVANLEQSWTLGAELTFYALSPFILRSRLAIWFLLGLSAVTRFITVHKFGFDTLWTYQFFPATVVFFLLGAMAFDAAENLPWLKSPIVGAALLAAVPLLLMYPDYAYWDTWRFWMAFLCFAVALPSIFSLTKNSRLLNALGDLSYPVYLTHGLVIAALGYFACTEGVTGYFGPTTRSAWVILISALLAMLVVGYAVHRLVEVRAAKLMGAGIDWLTKKLEGMVATPVKPLSAKSTSSIAAVPPS
jgi:peptidoglycan/LPS O-acetylase OafA/YrhL